MTSLSLLNDRFQPTRRELEVGGLVCKGLANQEIALRLHLGEQTVKFHLTNLYRKLGATNRTHLFVRMIEEGLTECPCSTIHAVTVDGRPYIPAPRLSTEGDA